MAGAAAVHAQSDDDEEEQEQDRTFSSRLGELMLEVQEYLENEEQQQALETLNRMLTMEPSPYERAVILQQRGAIYFQRDDLPRTIQDFQGAIATGALSLDEVTNLRVNLGQLLIAEEDIQGGIRQLELALENGAELNARLARLLAQAYAQAEDYREGLQYAEFWYENDPDKSVSEYSLMQFYYQQLNRPADELRVVREQVNAYPGNRQAWQNLVALYARTEQNQLAFEANKLMYLNGLFEECNELYRLAQYYSFYENPFRGATILEREINAGRCEGTTEQLETLANMWRQAAEFDRAIPVLEQISQQTGEGDTALKLAEAHYQLNNFEAAESAFETALNRGGLDQPGEAWVLLGTVRYELGDSQGALAAFREGARFRAARSQANGWISFVTSQIEGEQRRALQREQVLIDECRLTLEAERRQLVLVGEVDAEGRVSFPEDSIPERCRAYFNQFGEQYREAGMTDEQAEAARRQLERAAQQSSEEAG
ncbi:hypothetical protein DDZ18_09795 [Marinicauda salina]|uniref:Tetratricopeptide repeat protein n=1 Tax=Marinicauda salina TaxID=2135793 RepID=A0A2U2BT53_9PROT|nr:hypothetical protein DDZ18_09795 [Marinicauda salina]